MEATIIDEEVVGDAKLLLNKGGSEDYSIKVVRI